MAIPLSFAGLPLYIYSPDYYAIETGLSLALIGTIILVIRIFDAIQDPIIGILSQKFSQYRLAIMTGATALMALGFVMLFHPVTNIAAIWFTLSLLIATTTFSILSINLNSIGSLWSKDTNQKTRITTWREGLGLIGLLIAAILPSLFNLQIFSYILSGLLVLSAVIFFFWSKTHSNIIQKNENKIKKINFKGLIHSQNIWFFTTYTLSMIASAIPAVLVLFFIRDHLNAEAYTGIFLLLYFLSGALGMPLWQKLSNKTCKHAAWIMAMGLAVISFVWAAFLSPNDVWQYGIICFLSGIALGAELALPPSILSDQIDEQNNQDQTSLYFSAMAFLSKASLAIGSGIAFLILGFSSFTPASDNSETALQSLVLTYAVLPCIIKIIAIATMLLWFRHKKEKSTNEEFIQHHLNDRSDHVS